MCVCNEDAHLDQRFAQRGRNLRESTPCVDGCSAVDDLLLLTFRVVVNPNGRPWRIPPDSDPIHSSSLRELLNLEARRRLPISNL